MKHLFLVANTPFEKIELVIQKLNKNRDKQLSSLFLFGVHNNPNSLYWVDIFLLLGTNAFVANQSCFNPDSVGFMFADPMNLACIEPSKNISILDFKKKKEGFGYYMKKPTIKEIASKLSKVQKHKAELIKVKQFDPIPVIINSATTTTSFLPYFLGVYYSIRNLLIRERFKNNFIEWVISTQTPDNLKEKFFKLTKMKRSTRINIMCDLFDTEAGHKARSALKIVANSVLNSKSINVTKLSIKYKISPFDLRYMNNLFKNSLLLEDIDSNAVHIANTKFRYEEE